MGDAALTVEEAMHNFDLAAFYTNFLRDIQDIQKSDGTITDTVPFTYIHYSCVVSYSWDRFGSRPADPAWGAAYPTMVYLMWKFYGDERILTQHYEGLTRYIDFLAEAVKKTGLQKMFSCMYSEI